MLIVFITIGKGWQAMKSQTQKYKRSKTSVQEKLCMMHQQYKFVM